MKDKKEGMKCVSVTAGGEEVAAPCLTVPHLYYFIGRHALSLSFSLFKQDVDISAVF